MQDKKIAIFASGRGSNAVNIIQHFKSHETIHVALLISNRTDAFVVQAAEELGVKTMVLTNETAADASILIQICQENAIDAVILAGYLRKIPVGFIQAFTDKIINIHPSLLPKYGGQGMYGDKVHEAVLQNKELETGITIHFVNEHFDEGRIIAQFHCSISQNDHLADIQSKIHHLEQAYFPFVIEQTLKSSF